jgi:hypothetical protein
MSRWLKLIIGLAAALLAAWLAYGPLGRGEAYVDNLEQRSGAIVAAAELPGIQLHMRRDPLSRVAILCGPTNDLQRDGLRAMPGLTGRAALAGGVSGVRWQRPPPTPNGRTPACIAGARAADEGGIVPLLAEWLGLAALAWLIGLGLGWLIFRHRKREGYL